MASKNRKLIAQVLSNSYVECPDLNSLKNLDGPELSKNSLSRIVTMGMRSLIFLTYFSPPPHPPKKTALGMHLQNNGRLDTSSSGTLPITTVQLKYLQAAVDLQKDMTEVTFKEIFYLFKINCVDRTSVFIPTVTN